MIAELTRERLESGIRKGACAAGLDPDLCIRLCHALADLPADGKVGVFRVPPEVAREYGKDPEWWGGSVLAAVSHLEALVGRYDRVDRAVAAYLCGEEQFNRLVRSIRGDWRRALPFEVQAALKKVLDERSNDGTDTTV